MTNNMLDENQEHQCSASCPLHASEQTQLDRIEAKLDALMVFVNTAGAALTEIQQKGIGGMLKAMMGGGK